ncbi:hypothetical protein Y981_09395 [Leptospirillum ferriphilum YSK]|uniref:Uncharacterized protein n=1 Tax=Leptospirillum ferriphilum YSK TaxID=1441628 RepID=A0A059XYA3_9BACT|nr:hypothetical protein Y981_09395 [Leptospirillum ferriphilum YSK]
MRPFIQLPVRPFPVTEALPLPSKQDPVHPGEIEPFGIKFVREPYHHAPVFDDVPKVLISPNSSTSSGRQERTPFSYKLVQMGIGPSHHSRNDVV